MKAIQLNIKDTAKKWLETLEFEYQSNDYIVICESEDSLVWFATNLSQHFAVNGDSEVASLYGKHIKSLDSLCYQLSLCFPWGYQIKSNFHALYDLLLNFETEPKRRVLIWSDAHNLMQVNQKIFVSVFEKIIVAGYCNRKGIATIKDDGLPYMVRQNSFFLFDKNKIDEGKIMELLAQKFDIPRTNTNDEDAQISINLVKI